MLPSKEPDVLDTQAPSSRSHALPACVRGHISNLETWNLALDIIILPEFATY